MKGDRWQAPSPLIRKGVSPGTAGLLGTILKEKSFDGIALLIHCSTCSPSLIYKSKLCKLNFYHVTIIRKKLKNVCWISNPQMFTRGWGWGRTVWDGCQPCSQFHLYSSKGKSKFCDTGALTLSLPHATGDLDARHLSCASHLRTTATPPLLLPSECCWDGAAVRSLL